MTREKEDKKLISDLFKLVHPEDASGVPTMGPHLLTEARGVPDVAFRKFFRFYHSSLEAAESNVMALIKVMFVNKISMSQTCLYNISCQKATGFLQQPVTTEGVRL